MKKALLVLDMVQDFIDGDGSLFIGNHVNEIIAPINGLINEFLDAGDFVYFISTSLEEEHFKDNMEIPYCVIDTEGRDITPKIISILATDLHQIASMPKKTMSAFKDTALRRFVDTMGQFSDYYICGVHTSKSVLATVFDMVDLNYENIYVIKNAITDNTEIIHENAMNILSSLERVNIAEWVK